MSGHARQKFAGDLLFTVLNIVLNLVLIPRWGLLGAAVATSISLTGMGIHYQPDHHLTETFCL